MEEQVAKIMEAVIRLPHDVNGNPRYYVNEKYFSDSNGEMYRPTNAVMYRGKSLQAGWVFQSYNIKRSIEIAIEGHLGSN